MKRQQSRPHNFQENLAAEKSRLEAELAKAPHRPDREALKKKIRQIEVASQMDEWLTSPGLKPPVDDGQR